MTQNKSPCRHKQTNSSLAHSSCAAATTTAGSAPAGTAISPSPSFPNNSATWCSAPCSGSTSITPSKLPPLSSLALSPSPPSETLSRLVLLDMVSEVDVGGVLVGWGGNAWVVVSVAGGVMGAEEDLSAICWSSNSFRSARSCFSNLRPKTSR